MEEYKGVKFKVIREEGRLPENVVLEFLGLDRQLGRFIHPEENEGNLSIRADGGFLIKCAGARLTECSAADVALVTRIKGSEVHAIGGTPSSESLMHAEIYRRREDANAVLHFHSAELLARLEAPEVGPFPYGTGELARAVGNAAKTSDMVKIREHGIVLIANDASGLLAKLRRLYE